MDKYIKQITEVKITNKIVKQCFLTWKNTKHGRDVIQKYERFVTETGFVYYINCFNKVSKILKSNDFWYTLEKIYNENTNDN